MYDFDDMILWILEKFKQEDVFLKSHEVYAL
jgi:hypothetical protein